MGGGNSETYNLDAEQGGGYNYDETAAELQAFSDKAVRRGFIRKVYGILTCQLILTGGVIALFMLVDGLKEYTKENQWIHWSAFSVTIVLIIVMACFTEARRKAPMNFIFLGFFTAAEGVMLASFAAHFDTESVVIAVGICAAVTLVLTLFAFQTKIDFTACGGILLCLLMILMVSGIIMIVVRDKYAIIGYAAAGALIFMVYIVYDTQLMMGGKHKYALDPEEYVFAALNLYLDIVNLFMYILSIVGIAKK